MRTYEFDAVIHEIPEKGGAYIIFPYNIRKEFGKGRVKIKATFDGISYEGSIVNMGLKDKEENIIYIIGVLKSIRNTLGKGDGDSVFVTVEER